MERVVASSDGVPIGYEVHGSGTPALVFVHGWSCDRSYWRGQVDAFAARHRVVTVDLAGHGASGAGRSAWTMPAFGEDVVAVVAELGLDDLVLDDLVLVGHSMGGDVIVETALRLPGQVLGLVWVDTYATLWVAADMAAAAPEVALDATGCRSWPCPGSGISSCWRTPAPSTACSARSSPGSRAPVRNGPGTVPGQTARDHARP
jgi:pimeloyl-ACP methyl ester carboxylesterase